MAVQRNTIVIIWIMFLNGIAGYLNAGAVLEFLMQITLLEKCILQNTPVALKITIDLLLMN